MTSRFDAVAWMRQVRARIDEEDAGLSWEEKTQKTLSQLAEDPLWRHVKARVVDPSAPMRREARGSNA